MAVAISEDQPSFFLRFNASAALQNRSPRYQAHGIACETVEFQVSLVPPRLPPPREVRVGSTTRSQAACLVGIITVCALPFCDKPLLIAMSGVVAVSVLMLIWSRDNLPLLLLPAGYQFMQVTIALYYSTLMGIPLWSMSQYGSVLDPGIMVGLLGILCLAIGMRSGSRSLNSGRDERKLTVDRLRPIRVAAIVCISFYAISFFFILVASFFPTLNQPLMSLSAVKWAGVYYLAYSCAKMNKGYAYLGFVLVFEISLGFLGFFSAFKEVFFVVLIAFVSVRSRLRPRDWGLLAILVSLLLGLSLFWITVREDYRKFLNEGSGAQVVLRPVTERLQYLGGVVDVAGERGMGQQARVMVGRASYVEFLSRSVQTVPEIMPHTNGSLSGAALANIFMPRALFPNKPRLRNDTEVTMLYAGLALGGSRPDQASISIGYLGELYIDFGIAGVVIGTLVIGFAYGSSYRYFVRSRTGSLAMNSGLAVMVVMTTLQFEESLPKAVGGFVATFLAAALLKKFVPIVEQMAERSQRRNAIRRRPFPALSRRGDSNGGWAVTRTDRTAD